MYQFQTTTGISPKPVNVRYKVEDGLVYDVEIRSIATDEELSGYLAEYVNNYNYIEMECYADYRAKEKQEAANAEYDRGEDLYNERMAA